MSKYAATYRDFNVMVWHDSTARTGAHAADEHLYHSGIEAQAFAKMLRRLYPRDPVRIIDRADYDAEMRSYKERHGDMQDCS